MAISQNLFKFHSHINRPIVQVKCSIICKTKQLVNDTCHYLMTPVAIINSVSSNAIQAKVHKLSVLITTKKSNILDPLFVSSGNMSSAQSQFKAGQTHGRTQAKTEQWVESCKDSANAAADKTAQAADQTAGFLQQTSEQVKSMAQGAIDGVKNTLGVGDQQSKK